MMSQEPQDQMDHYSKVLYELSALVLNIMRSPPPSLGFPDEDSRIQSQRRQIPSFQNITPAGFASLLLGISLSLMVCGSVTFLLGFLLMPWVVGLVILLYFAGIVSSISMIGKALLCYNSSSPKKQVSWSSGATDTDCVSV